MDDDDRTAARQMTGASGQEGREVAQSAKAEASQVKDVMVIERSEHGTMPPELQWPGGDLRLTGRESELLALLPTGMTNRELGAHLYLSENTIKTQLRSLFSKLNVRNRVQAVALARNIVGVHHSQTSTDVKGNARTTDDDP